MNGNKKYESKLPYLYCST